MFRKFLLSLVLLCGSRAAVAQQEPVWALKFGDYVTPDTLAGKPASPVLVSKTHRMFRSVITQAARKGPNFAGHYTVAEWGCGSGCVSLAVLDARSGKAFSAPFKILSMPLAQGPGKHEYQGPVYQLRSRLLIADGCPEEKKCGTYYYEWADDRFKLLRFDAQAGSK